jgi:hippurate hydrolase
VVLRTCQGVAAAHGVRVRIEHRAEYPVTVNDDERAELALDVAAALGVDHAVRLANPIMGSEDFSRVLAQLPGAMVFLGATAREAGPDPAGNHAPVARFADETMPLGTALLCELAIRTLDRHRTEQSAHSL